MAVVRACGAIRLKPCTGGSRIESLEQRTLLSGGLFAPAVEYAVGSSVSCTTAGDFDGDGISDLAVGRAGGVSVMLGRSDGTLAARVDYAAGTSGGAPAGMSVGDLNGDGKLDLVVADPSGRVVSVLLGNGDGSFAAKLDCAVASGPMSVSMGDFDRDGKLDLLVANSIYGSLGVLPGNGDGTFGPMVTSSTSAGSGGVGIGDVNGDGVLDLVVPNPSRAFICGLPPQPYSSVSVLLGNGDGSFATAAEYGAGDEAAKVSLGDLNGDGYLDLVVVHRTLYDINGTFGSWLGVMLGKRDGTFGAEVECATTGAPGSVSVGDFNGDGKLDLSVKSLSYSAPGGPSQTSVSIYLGKGDGTFALEGENAGGPGNGEVSIGDFNGDGRPDLAVAGSDGQSVGILLNAGGTDSLPRVSVAAPSSIGRGNVAIPYTLQDAESETCDLLVQYSCDGGLTWKAASAASGSDGTAGLASSPAGKAYRFIWDSQRDLGNTHVGARIRISPSDHCAGASATTGAFRVANGSNQAPAVTVSLSSQNPRTQSSLTATATKTDADGDPVTLTYIWRVNGEIKRTITLGSGVSDALNLGWSGYGYKGDQISVEVIASDGLSTTTTQSTATVVDSPLQLGYISRRGAPGSSIQFRASDFTTDSSDPDQGDCLQRVKIVQLPRYWTLRLAGEEVVAGQEIPVDQLDQLTGTPISTEVMPNDSFLWSGSDGTLWADAPASASLITEVPGVDYVTWSNARKVSFGDVNGDGRQDLIIINYAGSLSVLLGNGDGTFAAKTDYAVGDNPQSVSIGDLNGDGKPDLAVANWNSSSVSVLLGQGDGTFYPRVDYSVGGSLYKVDLRDLNGDGRLDLMVACYGKVSVLLGKGDGTFSSQVDHAVEHLCSEYMADVDGDGVPDLVVAGGDEHGYSMSILLGKGDGTFGLKADYPLAGYPCEVKAADLNGDGHLDLVVTSWDSSSVSVLLGEGDGSFLPRVDYVGIAPFPVQGGLAAVQCYTADARLADLNGDGKLDLLVLGSESAYYTGNGVRPVSWSCVHILLGRGDGTFVSKGDVDGCGLLDTANLSVQDFNGDGTLDLIAPAYDDYYRSTCGPDVSVLLGKGDGTFAPARSYTLELERFGSVADLGIGDVNGDGRLDFVAARYDSVRVYLNTFAPEMLVVDAGTRSFVGTAGNDSYIVRLSADGTTVEIYENASLNGGPTYSISRSELTGLRFDLGGGDDSISIQCDIPCTIYGGNGNDTVMGGSGMDVIYGGAGGDLLSGGGGMDQVYGEDGNDTLWGSSSEDVMDGGAGDNQLRDPDGAYLGGESVTVVLDAHTRVLTILGSTGNDRISMGLSPAWTRDRYHRTTPPMRLWVKVNGKTWWYAPSKVHQIVVEGGSGNDRIEVVQSDYPFRIPVSFSGGSGNDTLIGGGANDTLLGGLGDDALRGGNGNDSLCGGDGDDLLYAQAGRDTLEGGDGGDRYVFPSTRSAITCSIRENGVSGTDTLDFRAISSTMRIGLDHDVPNCPTGTIASYGKVRVIGLEQAGQNVEMVISRLGESLGVLA